MSLKAQRKRLIVFKSVSVNVAAAKYLDRRSRQHAKAVLTHLSWNSDNDSHNDPKDERDGGREKEREREREREREGERDRKREREREKEETEKREGEESNSPCCFYDDDDDMEREARKFRCFESFCLT
jgi:hypothetical protein